VKETPRLQTTEDTEDAEKPKLRSLDSEALGHFVVEETFVGIVGLDPFSIDHELRDGPFSGVFDDLVDGAGVVRTLTSLNGMLCFARKRLASRQSGHVGVE